MAKIVVVGGKLQCSHGGIASLSSGNDKLKVDGKAAITSGNEIGISFAVGEFPCPHPNPSPPPLTVPCTATQAASPDGISTKIKVDGLGLLLETATGPATNAGDPSATWEVLDPGQTKLEEI